MVTSADLGSSFDIEELHLSPQQAAVVRGTVYAPDIATFLGRAFSRVAGVAAGHGARVTGPPFATYTVDTGTFEIRAGFPVDSPLPPLDGVEPAELPGGPALRILHVGRYEDVGRAYQAGEDWLTAHHKAHRGAPWECYLDDPEVEHPRTAVFIPFGDILEGEES